MRNFKEALRQDMALERKMLLQYRKELEGLPKGSLSSYIKKGKRYYQWSFSKRDRKSGQLVQERRYIGVENDVLIAQLKRKGYLVKAISQLERNLKCQEALEKAYGSYAPDAVIATMGKAYEEVAMDWHLQDDGAIDKMQRSAIADATYPEGRTQPTMAGIFVRSKSEAIIVNAMSERGIRFVYEEPIRLRDRAGREVVLRPDFVIHLASGEIIIWEHLGMLDDDRYRETLDFKLKAYHEAGYIMGKNLFFYSRRCKGQIGYGGHIQSAG